MVFQLDFEGPYRNMCLGNALIVCDLYGLFLTTFQFKG